MSNFDKHVLAFFPTHIRFSPIQRLQSIRKIINFWYTFGWKWRVISFRDCLGLLNACSYDLIGRVDRFGFQDFCSPGKNLKKSSLDQKADDLETRYTALGARVLPSLLKWWPRVDLDLFNGKVKFDPLYFCMGKKVKQWIFQKLL